MNQLRLTAVRWSTRWKAGSRSFLLRHACTESPSQRKLHNTRFLSTITRKAARQTRPKVLEYSLIKFKAFSSLDRAHDDAQQSITSLTPPVSSNFPSSAPTEAALQRALQMKPDKEWDDIIEEESNRHVDKNDPKAFVPPEAVMLEDDEVSYPRAFRRRGASDGAWNERRSKVASTKALLDAHVGSWGLEQWIEVEQLLLNYWAKEPSIRAVVLQFGLNLRIMQEKDYVQRYSDNNNVEPNGDLFVQSSGEDSMSASFYLNINRWFNFQALTQLLANWNLVYVGGQSDILTDCNLGSTDLLDTVIHVYHGKYGMKLSERILSLVVSGEVGALTAGQRPVLADIILDYAMTLFESGQKNCYPKTQLCNLVATAWIKSALGQETVDRVTNVLDQMRRMEIKFDRLTFQQAVRVQILRGSKEAATKAESILQQMYKEYIDGNTYVQPNPLIFSNVVLAWANSGSKEAGPRGEQIYRQMILLREQKHVHEGTSFDPLVVNNVLQCWGATKLPNAAIKAEEFWRNTEVPGTNVTYGTLSRLYSERGDIPSVERLLEEMENAAKTSDKDENNSVAQISKPDCYSYTALLSAYAKSNRKDKKERAEAVLARLKQKGIVKPNTAVYNAFLSVLASVKDGFPGTRADEIFGEMKEAGKKDTDVLPDAITYASLVNVWARFGRAEKADKLVSNMYEDYVSGRGTVKPDLHAFNTVLAAYSRSVRKDAAEKAEIFFERMKEIAYSGVLENFRPDIFSVNSLIACLANSQDNRAAAAAKAEGLLHDMRSRFQAGDKSWQPTSHSYNSVMNAFARAGEPTRAEAVFNLMCDDFKRGNELAKPGAPSFNTRIKAWGFSRQPDAPLRAEEILQQMHDLKQSGAIDVTPDVRTYTGIVLCYGLSGGAGAPQRAEAIVHHMDQLHKAGHLSEGPNKKTFTTLKQAWLSSNEPNKEKHADAIRREIQKRFGKGR